MRPKIVLDKQERKEMPMRMGDATVSITIEGKEYPQLHGLTFELIQEE